MATDSITLIAPYLASNAIGPRAARSRRLAAGLRAAGHPVHAVVVDDGSPPDESLDGAVLASAPGPLVGDMGEPGMNARRRFRAAAADRARRLLPLPDAHVRWAAAVLRDPALEHPPDPHTTIYAVAAPFSSLVVGALLGRRWGVPVIGDLGDPWPVRGAADARLAAWTMRQLSALIVTTEPTADAYRGQVAAGTEIRVAANGADRLQRIERPPGAAPLFLQLGTLSGLRTDPGNAFRALAELDREGLIEFRSHGEAWVQLAPGVAHHHLGVVSPDEARALMQAATAVVVVGNRNPIQIPSKVYEVARSQAWALCVSELDGEPGAEILQASGHGVIRGNDEAEIRAGALEILARERRGERPQSSPRYSWEAMLDRIIALVEDGAGIGGGDDTPAASLEVDPGLVPGPVRVGAGTALLLRGEVDPADLGAGPLRLELGDAVRAPVALSLGRGVGPGRLAWWSMPVVSGSIEPGPTRIRLLSGDAAIDAGAIELAAGAPEPPVAAASSARGSDPLIAICMATYEPDELLLRRQIDSIREQEWENWICVISDDCSSPEAFARIERAVGDDERFVVSRSPDRLGFYANFERALALAPPQAELIALCDQDDRWYEGKLRALHRALVANPRARLAYSDMRVVDERGRVISDSFWYQSWNAFEDIGTLAIVNTVTGGAALFERSVLDLALPFPPAFSDQHYHDHWIALCALAIGELAYLDRPTYDYTRRRASITIAASRQWAEPPRGVIGRAAASLRVILRRLRLATEPGSWSSAYLDRFLMLRQYVLILRLRAWDQIAPDKRAALQRIERADRSAMSVAWLAARTLRPLLGKRETLGRERVLLGGLIWRRIDALRVRRRRGSTGI